MTYTKTMEGKNNLSLSTGIIIPTLKQYNNLSDKNVIALVIKNRIKR